MQPDDRVRIQHMIEACDDAVQFSAGRARKDLDNDRMLLFAILRAIEIVGEAASRVSKATQHDAPEVPWTRIAGMRNRLVHAYFNVNLNLVWKSVTRDIPTLLPQLQALIDQKPPEET